MHRGYIKLWRKITDHPLHPLNHTRAWTNYEAMLDLVMMAHGSDVPKKVLKGNQTIEIKRGQLDRTVRQLSIRWRWSVGKTSMYIKRLISVQVLSVNVNRWFSLITIQNYDEYNPLNEQKMNGSRTEDEQNVNTYKESIKKGNEDNDNSGVVKKSLIKWFSNMEDVKNPEGLSEFYLKKFPANIIKKALANSNCTSRAKLSGLCADYLKKQNATP